MNTLDHILVSWPWEPWLAASLLVAAAWYWRGWRILQHRDRQRWTGAKLAAYCGGLTAIYLALASPLETFASLVLPAHMAQHLLLMMAAPPLVWLGAPLLPLLCGTPRELRRVWIAPLLRRQWLRNCAALATHPVAAWLIFVGTVWLWHLPTMYELALAYPTWHYVQHSCFLAAGLLFWYPIVRPYPARPAWPTWLLVPYLILADIQNTVLSALLTFSDHVLYLHYQAMPRLGSGSVLDDQAAAGAMMWVPGSVVFLLPLGWIGVRLLWKVEWGTGNTNRRRRNGEDRKEQGKLARGFTISPVRQFTPSAVLAENLPSTLRLPPWLRLVRLKATRPLVQAFALVITAAMIVDGLFGPQAAPMNLAGVVPWIHWRGFIIFGLLVVGNIFCYGCPFMLPRTIARRWLPAGRNWPRWLRSKWLAVAILAVFLWSYEAFSLWNSPWLTAWIAIAYFIGALVIDGIFRDAPFCKYICPIGQFHFVHAVVSPLEVKVRQLAVCANCTTHDCMIGRADIPGCELHLFQPRKRGNLDCTFCLDCVRACPHDNVGVLPVAPTASLWQDGLRSGIGRLSRRFDYAALAMLLVFGAFANAAGMIAPVVGFEDRIAKALNFSSTFGVTTAFYAVSLVILPLVSAVAASGLSRLAVRDRSLRMLACRFAWSLIPLGFAMWTAHYSFHFFTSMETIVPATQRFVTDFGMGSLGTPNWTCSCCRPAPDWLLKFELVMLDFGLLASLYAAWRMAKSMADSPRATVKIALPWAVLATALFFIGVWILLQPMEMRGTIPG
ncbi:MAG: cytochrome c oxidase assembly protein [Pirellulales bacterium]|nr:cytochrome c oxidase assembly protein [Pirellulales bacterium]